MIEAIERSQRKLAPSDSGRVMCAKSVLAVALAFGLSSCALLSRDGSENGQQIAAQIKAGDLEVVDQLRPGPHGRARPFLRCVLDQLVEPRVCGAVAG